ncbi:family 20 glycosylhydrolase [Panacibacter ginsenosidivorans]|uniref:Family 20 glycosylhydrolase n=1 Tax=Panacibacter ginsenosidivorans TaxID=1813871 RepID=A0A5B8VC49_9BACT|nr:family 20 glycosylhydrolase [Panacibacter ginsenosidivorans]QEC67848.1 family 20 glycosylhydrolase [Panacibacter ginsenosidivorans]
MKNKYYSLLIIFIFSFFVHNSITAQALTGSKSALDSIIPVRGFCIAAPAAKEVDRFVKFINEELAPRKVNTLILRVDYNYAYESHPELRDNNPLSKNDVKQLVNACKKNKIRLIPQVNLLGHQSWANKNEKLLEVYPDFDETPYVKMPVKYEWPNADNLYCKSYCPLHPGVHKVVFDIVDEICDAFETDAFHAGMDEVFYLGEDGCPRCGGRDKAELFAEEVRTIRDHLAQKNRQLWIWGDRLIDGKTTGLGMWEASYNNTYRAIDMIPKDIMICDWHYERADKTPVYFAMKGLDIVTCPWRMPALAVTQTADMVNFRKQSSPEMSEHFKGMMQTVWSDAGSFLDGFYGIKKDDKAGENTPWDCFRALYQKLGTLAE